MKNLIKAVIVVSAFIATTNLAMANDTCKPIADAARATMSARQSGVSMQKMLAVFKNPQLAEISVVGQQMVIQVFEKPQFQTAENRARMVNEFENEWMLKCVKFTSQRGK